MAYSLVSIYEKGDIVDGIVPSNWIVNNKVYWSNSAFAERDAQNRIEVNLNWPPFTLEKIRFSHDDMRECEDYHWSSASESEKEATTQTSIQVPVLPTPPKMHQVASSPPSSLLRRSPRKTQHHSPHSLSSNSPRKRSDDSFPHQSLLKTPNRVLENNSSSLPSSTLRKTTERKSPHNSSTFPSSSLTESPVSFTAQPSSSLRKSPRKQFPSLSSTSKKFQGKSSLQESSKSFVKAKKTLSNVSLVSLRRSPRKRPHRDEEDSNTSDSFSDDIEIPQPRPLSKEPTKKKKKNGAEYNKSRYPLSDSDFQRKMFNLLLEIRELLYQRGPTNDANDDFDTIEICRSNDDLVELDEELIEEDKFQTFVRKLTRVGGKNFSNNVKNVLLTVASDEVWSEYSFAGRKKKRKFKDSRICTAITNALLRCTRSSKSEIEKTIARIIKHAPERVK